MVHLRMQQLTPSQIVPQPGGMTICNKFCASLVVEALYCTDKYETFMQLKSKSKLLVNDVCLELSIGYPGVHLVKKVGKENVKRFLSQPRPQCFRAVSIYFAPTTLSSWNGTISKSKNLAYLNEVLIADRILVYSLIHDE